MAADPAMPALLVVGSCNLDMQLSVAHLPVEGETQLAAAYARSAGGKGANQAAAAAKLGACVSLLGAVGRDDAGCTIADALEQAGVDTSLLLRVEEPTGIAAILLTGEGRNSIVVAPGANHVLAPEDVRAHAAQIAGASLVLTQLETSLAVLKETLAVAHAAGTPVMLDPAPAQRLPAELLERVDWFTPNAHEAAFYLGSDASHVARNPREAAEALRQPGPRAVLLKLGAQGACALTAEGAWHSAAAPRVHAVDTTGAGDTMNAAFAVALARQQPIEAALQYAVAAATLSVTRPGALPASPTEQELAAFLRANS